MAAAPERAGHPRRRIYVDEFGDGEITVVLISEVENDGEQWPLDVLRLPAEKQQAILNQLR